MATPEYAGILPAVPFVCGIILYNTFTLSLKTFLSKAYPHFYADLASNRRSRLDPYIAFLTGWLITLFSTPICTIAALHASPEAALFDAAPHSTRLEQFCVGSRVVLWVGETPRLEFSNLYTAHHGFSLAAFAAIEWIEAPRMQLFVLYAALATELVSTLIAALKITGWNVGNSGFVACATRVNVLLLAGVRVPSALWCIWLVLDSGTTGMRVLVNVGSLLVYVVYLIYITGRQAQSLGVLRVERRAPARLVLFESFSVSLYAVFVGIAWIASTLSSMWLYGVALDKMLSDEEICGMVVLGMKVGVAGLLGAAGIPVVLGVRKLPRGEHPNCATRGLWLQAGEALMGLTLLLAHFDDSAQKRALLCSAGLVLPLGEAIGRVGCFYGGCCDGRASRKRGEEKDGFIGCNGSIPLLSASINLTLYVVVVTLLMCGVLSIEEAALLAVAFNGFVRVFANHFRKDLTRLRGLRGVSPTTLFASFQGVGAMLAFSRL